MIGRFVDVHADLDRVRVSCEGRVVADHPRSWARRVVVTDPAHVATAARLRTASQHEQAARATARRHHDGHHVQLRALPDYDALFAVTDFTTPGHDSAGHDSAGHDSAGLEAHR
jgi:Mu transposase-like protein